MGTGLRADRHTVIVEEGADDFEAVYEYVMQQGWGDGLPVVPPTEERVRSMLAHTKREPDEVIALVPPRYGAATVEKVAINAVMAGCRPEYFPVVLAAVEACCAPEFNLYAIQTTTNPVAPLVVLNGPARKRLGFNCGINALGQGNRANATVGRALRLVLVNIGGGKPGEGDLATQGMPGKYTFCCAENEEETPWEPYHVEHGFAPDDSTVTVFGVQALHNVIDIVEQTARELLFNLARAMAAVGTNNMTHGGQPLLILSPEHARIVARDGFTKDDVRHFLYEHARIPLSQLPARTRELMLKRRPKWVNVDALPIADRPKDFELLVIGGPGIHSIFAPTFGSTWAVTRRIEWSG